MAELPSGAVFDAEFARSRAFFQDVGSYVPFSLTADGQRIIGCVEPRDELEPGSAQPRDLKVTMQGGGGAYGQGVELGIARTAAGEGFMPIEQALSQDKSSRPGVVLGAHDNCAYWLNLPDLLDIQASPDDFTLDALTRSLHYYELTDALLPLLPAVKGAAAQHASHFRAHGQGDILPHVNELYPGHKNVFKPLGENNAYFWVTNRLTNFGLDRTAKHRGQKLAIHGYHFGEAALLESLTMARGMSREVRDHRALALLLGGAAARTLLGSKHSETEYYSLIRTNHGPQITVLPGQHPTA